MKASIITVLLSAPLGILTSNSCKKDEGGTPIPREPLSRIIAPSSGMSTHRIVLPVKKPPPEKAHFPSQKEPLITSNDGSTQRFQLDEERPRMELSNILDDNTQGKRHLPLVHVFPIEGVNRCRFVIWEHGGGMWSGELPLEEDSFVPAKSVLYYSNS